MAIDAEVPAEAEGASDADGIRELVRRCADGDREALKAFFDRYSEDIYNFPMKVFHLDQDAGSDFFLYAFERLRGGARFRSFQGRSSFRTWFYTVLRNLVIDWMRTIREVETVNVGRTDERGNEYRMIENAPDPRSLMDGDAADVNLPERLGQLSLELRVVFKLSYIYYMELDPEELAYAARKAGLAPEDLTRKLAQLRHALSSKELKNLGAEDKITALYLAILDLKGRRDRLAGALKADLSGAAPGDPEEIARLDRAINKKYQQRERLLQRKVRGHFIVRTPYRVIGDLLNIPEGSVSVQMMRALERVRSPGVRS